MKILPPELRSLRYPLRQFCRSIKAGRPLSWPTYRRLMQRFGVVQPSIRFWQELIHSSRWARRSSGPFIQDS